MRSTSTDPTIPRKPMIPTRRVMTRSASSKEREDLPRDGQARQEDQPERVPALDGAVRGARQAFEPVDAAAELVEPALDHGQAVVEGEILAGGYGRRGEKRVRDGARLRGHGARAARFRRLALRRRGTPVWGRGSGGRARLRVG